MNTRCFFGRECLLRSLGQKRHKGQWSRSLLKEEVEMLACDLSQRRALVKRLVWWEDKEPVSETAWLETRLQEHLVSQHQSHFHLNQKIDKTKSWIYWQKVTLSKWRTLYFFIEEQSRNLRCDTVGQMLAIPKFLSFKCYLKCWAWVVWGWV